jgi:hypothetical protein
LEAIVVPFALSVTEPRPLAKEGAGVTVMVNVTGWPPVEGLGLEETVTLVAAWV